MNTTDALAQLSTQQLKEQKKAIEAVLESRNEGESNEKRKKAKPLLAEYNKLIKKHLKLSFPVSLSCTLELTVERDIGMDPAVSYINVKDIFGNVKISKDLKDNLKEMFNNLNSDELMSFANKDSKELLDQFIAKMDEFNKKLEAAGLSITDLILAQ